MYDRGVRQPAIEGVANASDLETALGRLLTSAASALASPMGAILVQDPDRPGLQPVSAKPARSRL